MRLFPRLLLSLVFFTLPGQAQNLIDFEACPVDESSNEPYQQTTPFFPGVMIHTIDNETGEVTGWPVVVRANSLGKNGCMPELVDPGVIGAFASTMCEGVLNYPTHSPFNSLSDVAEGVTQIPGPVRFQDGFLVSFQYPVKYFSLYVADWGDYFPNETEQYPSSVQLVAKDKDGNVVAATSGPSLYGVDPLRDAKYPGGQMQLSLTGSGIRTVELRFMGRIDPGVSIDDIAFTGELFIDVKPGSDPNCFNSNGHGAIPVAILGSEELDVSIIDPATIHLDGQPVLLKGNGTEMVSQSDVNADGYTDLVVKIEDQDIYQPGSYPGTLSATSYDGWYFEGSDLLCVTQ